MDLAGWRDIALIVIAILSSIVAILAAGVFGAIWWFGRKGFKILDRVIAERARPLLGNVELQLLALRDQSARLPGSRQIGLGEAPVRKRRGLPFPLPFGLGRKRRRFPLLPS